MKRPFQLVFLLALLVPATSAFAQNVIAYIMVAAPGTTGQIVMAREDFAVDFFAFSDFDKKIDAPASYDPKTAYVITRYELVGDRQIAFDKLYYYPEQGYVYYEGVSKKVLKYNKQWYAAKPEIKETFRAALAERSRVNMIPFLLVSAILIIGAASFYRATRKSKIALPKW